MRLSFALLFFLPQICFGDMRPSFYAYDLHNCERWELLWGVAEGGPDAAAAAKIQSNLNDIDGSWEILLGEMVFSKKKAWTYGYQYGVCKSEKDTVTCADGLDLLLSGAKFSKTNDIYACSENCENHQFIYFMNRKAEDIGWEKYESVCREQTN